MKTTIVYKGRTFQVNLENPIDISLSLQNGEGNVSAWYCAPPRFEPVMTEHFTGDVRLGGAVNFRDVFFNPHGHGTHTECVGHISKEQHSLKDSLKQFNMPVLLKSFEPETSTEGDHFISARQMATALKDLNGLPALIIRTLPNSIDKQSRQYSNTNPAFLEPQAAQLLVEAGVEHLLIDTPSVDKEEDGGALAAHHIFWNYPENPRINCTISELVFIPDAIADGEYWMQLCVANFNNDAAPSRPLLYQLL